MFAELISSSAITLQQSPRGFQCINVRDRLIPADGFDAWKSQRESRVMPAGSADGIEGDLQHDVRLDVVLALFLTQGVALEMIC